MCLSDAYELVDGEQKLILSRVQDISTEDDCVLLTNLMGIRQKVPGRIKSVSPALSLPPFLRRRAK